MLVAYPTALLCALLLAGRADTASFTLRDGDILFQDDACGDFCDAIRRVTHGYQGRAFSHNGMVQIEGGRAYVLEAIRAGVRRTPLANFLQRSLDSLGRPKVIVGRLKASHRALIPDALAYAETLVGQPYDPVFDLDNDAYYCSELIHLSLQYANKGVPLFETPPMTYRDPETQQTFPVWERYFAALGVPIPEGKPGLNPGGMSRAPVIDIIHDFQQP